MAVLLIDALTSDLDPSKDRDTYCDQVLQLIEAPTGRGGGGDREAEPETASVTDQMEMRRQSVEAAGPGATGHRPTDHRAQHRSRRPNRSGPVAARPAAARASWQRHGGQRRRQHTVGPWAARSSPAVPGCWPRYADGRRRPMDGRSMRCSWAVIQSFVSYDMLCEKDGPDPEFRHDRENSDTLSENGHNNCPFSDK